MTDSTTASCIQLPQIIEKLISTINNDINEIRSRERLLLFIVTTLLGVAAAVSSINQTEALTTTHRLAIFGQNISYDLFFPAANLVISIFYIRHIALYDALAKKIWFLYTELRSIKSSKRRTYATKMLANSEYIYLIETGKRLTIIVYLSATMLFLSLQITILFYGGGNAHLFWIVFISFTVIAIALFPLMYIMRYSISVFSLWTMVFMYPVLAMGIISVFAMPFQGDVWFDIAPISLSVFISAWFFCNLWYMQTKAHPLSKFYEKARFVLNPLLIFGLPTILVVCMLYVYLRPIEPAERLCFPVFRCIYPSSDYEYIKSEGIVRINDYDYQRWMHFDLPIVKNFFLVDIFHGFRFRDLREAILVKNASPSILSRIEGAGYEKDALKSAEGVNLRGQSLRAADFSHAVLYRANFTSADLRDATFQDARLHNAVFFDAKLRVRLENRGRGLAVVGVA